MRENQDQRNQADQHEGGLEHETRAARQDLQAQPEQTPSRHDGARRQPYSGFPKSEGRWVQTIFVSASTARRSKTPTLRRRGSEGS